MDIREARNTLGLTQPEFAKMLGIDAPTLSKIENGIVAPTPTMCGIAFKALASHSNARNGVGSINVSTSLKKSLKTEICDSILEALTYTSYDQPISRDSLKVWTKRDDRQNRDAITALRKQGYRIGSFSGGKGYWMCKTEEEYQIVRNMYLSKVRDMLETVAAMDRSLPGQMEMDYGEIFKDIQLDMERPRI